VLLVDLVELGTVDAPEPDGLHGQRDLTDRNDVTDGQRTQSARSIAPPDLVIGVSHEAGIDVEQDKGGFGDPLGLITVRVVVFETRTSGAPGR
jgi:hypothetical protein